MSASTTSEPSTLSMSRKRTLYTPEQLEKAVSRARAGEKYAAVARDSYIPVRTLYRAVKRAKATGAAASARRGPKSIIPPQLEADLVEWVAAMQRIGLPVGRDAVLTKACEIYASLHPMGTRSSPSWFTGGWYARFVGRHPALSVRTPQRISRVRNSVDESALWPLFGSLAKVIIENSLDAPRVFNMDETSFMPRGTSKVLAVKGSSNVWTKETRLDFHMTVVAAVSAAGWAVPPLIIVPGKRLFRADLAGLSIDGASLTGAAKGFSNGGVFKQWLSFFSGRLTSARIKMPVLLVLDNSSTHIDHEVIELCSTLEIFLVALPANATHLFQPLDVAVFRPFKGAVQHALQRRLTSTAATRLSKAEAISIACGAFKDAVVDRPSNAISGFKSTGLFPLSLPLLRQRLAVYSSGGVKGDLGTAPWLTHREEIVSTVRNSVLALPPAEQPKQKKQRKTVDIAGRLVTKDLLQMR